MLLEYALLEYGLDWRATMSTAEKIAENIKVLPEPARIEVLDFIQFLVHRRLADENADWSALSVHQAMRGMEDEPDIYSEADLKEVFQ